MGEADVQHFITRAEEMLDRHASPYIANGVSSNSKKIRLDS